MSDHAARYSREAVFRDDNFIFIVYSTYTILVSEIRKTKLVLLNIISCLQSNISVMRDNNSPIHIVFSG